MRLLPVPLVSKLRFGHGLNPHVRDTELRVPTRECENEVINHPHLNTHFQV